MRLSSVLIFVLLVPFGAGCDDRGGSSPLDQIDVAREAVSNARNTGATSEMHGGVEQIARNQTEGVMIEPVDFRKLKELLPEELAGMERVSSSGEKRGAMGMSFSKASGEYASERENTDGTIEITITDLGSLKSAAVMGYRWMTMEIDRESDNGYEKTTEYEGYPAHEKFERRGSSAKGEMQVVVGERFVVAIEGHSIEMDRVKEAISSVNLDRLEVMKDEGIKRAG